MEPLTLGLYVVALVISALGTYFAFRVNREYRAVSKGWMILSIAALLITLHRALILADYVGTLGLPFEDVRLMSGVIYLLVSLAILVGAWRVKEMSESYRLVHKEAMESIQELDRKVSARMAKGRKPKK